MAAGQADGGQGQGGRPSSVIVIGGGVGGVAVAGRLAKAGLQVTLLEKNAEARVQQERSSMHTAAGPPCRNGAAELRLNAAAALLPSQVGGRLQSATSPGGFRHDTGPSLLLFPDK